MLPECASYLEMLDDLRGQIAKLIAGLPAEALNWRPIEGEDDHITNSLAVMTAHVAGAEHFWIHEVAGDQPATRNRPVEFLTEVDSAEPLLETLKETGLATRKVLTMLTAADLDSVRQAHDRNVPMRWAILHAIDHTALHLGHMQITYQLWARGQTAESPRWFQRLKDDQ
ncbi:MAG: DinB family protein [Chloroflexota bacterium]|jgi:uncharacterized damage-inducible protein DinB